MHSYDLELVMTWGEEDSPTQTTDDVIRMKNVGYKSAEKHLPDMYYRVIITTNKI